MALLQETLDAKVREHYSVVEYSNVCEIIRRLPLNPLNGYHFVIDQYRTFLSSTLPVFDLIRKLGIGQLSPNDFATQFANITAGLELRDNDIRTLSYFYYFNFEEYLQRYATDLLFGTVGYDEGENTRWLFEKNMQGPPYMEAIIGAPFSKHGNWRMHEVFRHIFENERFAIAPRIEIWLAHQDLTAPSSKAGTLLLGTWSSTLRKYLSEADPYRFALSPVGHRNFHREQLLVSYLPFSKLAERLRSLLTKVFHNFSLEHETTS